MEHFHQSDGVHLIDGAGLDDGEFIVDEIDVEMREAVLAPARCEELAVAGGEKPRARFRGVAELVAVGGPDVKGLLRKIPGIVMPAGEAQGKTMERLVE